MAVGAESIGRQFRIAGDAPAMAMQTPLIQINASLGVLPNMTAGDGPDAVHSPKIPK
jgi:hypothetical protein